MAPAHLLSSHLAFSFPCSPLSHLSQDEWTGAEHTAETQPAPCKLPVHPRLNSHLVLPVVLLPRAPHLGPALTSPALPRGSLCKELPNSSTGSSQHSKKPLLTLHALSSKLPNPKAPVLAKSNRLKPI